MKGWIKGGVVAALMLLFSASAAMAAQGVDGAYERGLEAARSGRHLEAAEAFKEAYRIDPNPSLLWNAARSASTGGDLVEARRLYMNYMGHPEAKPDKAAQAKGWLEANPEQPAMQGGSVTVLTRPHETLGNPALGWTLCGLGIAALVGGSVSLAMASQSRDATYGLTWGADHEETLAKHRQLARQTETREVAAWVSFGTATALLTSGLVVLMSGASSPPSDRGLSLGLTPTSGGVSASAGWRF